MATEIISRADTSLMNLFGLQGIAETDLRLRQRRRSRTKRCPSSPAAKSPARWCSPSPTPAATSRPCGLRAFQDEQGNWYLNGVKRFITNGCGEILLVLARSEPEISDGRGLSLFIAERSERVKVRHLERQAGHPRLAHLRTGLRQHAPARLIGERQRGLITYVMALMNGARVGIAAQSLGVAEAAYRLARTYAHTRQQFGGPIERLPAVAEMGHRHADRHRGRPSVGL